MVRFVRRLWLNAAGHCGLAVPIEIFEELSGGRAESLSCVLQIENGRLVVEPIKEEI